VFSAHVLSTGDRGALLQRTLADFEKTDWGCAPAVHLDEAAHCRTDHSMVAAYVGMLKTALAGSSPVVVFFEDDLRFNLYIRHNMGSWSPLTARQDGCHFAGLEETGFHGDWITWDLGSLGC
jgi:hypothetical protein